MGDIGNMGEISFEPITRAHFALLGNWLAQAHVARWWAADPALAAIEADYGGNVDGTEPARVFIAYCAGTPLGLVQRYRVAWYPHYFDELKSLLDVPAHATSMDYFIGPPEALRRGWGTRLLRALVATIWCDDPITPALVVPVHADNVASCRVLERIGLARVAAGDLEPDNPADHRGHFIYRIDRPHPS